MPHVPASLNWFSADGCYGWACSETGNVSSPGSIRAAYEAHILPKLLPNQSAIVIPGTYECDSAKMEAPPGSYWQCVPGSNASYDSFIGAFIVSLLWTRVPEPTTDSCLPLACLAKQMYPADKVTQFAAWARAEPRIHGAMPWHYNNRCVESGTDFQCGCTTAQSCCKEVGKAGTPSWWQAGAMSIPKTLAAVRTIGRGILASRNQTQVAVTDASPSSGGDSYDAKLAKTM